MENFFKPKKNWKAYARARARLIIVWIAQAIRIVIVTQHAYSSVPNGCRVGNHHIHKMFFYLREVFFNFNFNLQLCIDLHTKSNRKKWHTKYGNGFMDKLTESGAFQMEKVNGICEPFRMEFSEQKRLFFGKNL